MAAPDPSLDPRLVRRRVRVQASDVAWLRALTEAYDGLALLYGDGSGAITLAAPVERAAELDAWLAEMSRELPLQRLE